MLSMLNTLEQAGCDISYGLKMHVNREDYYLRELRDFAYDTTLEKLGTAVDGRDASLCYVYSKTLSTMYAGLGFLSALYISDSIAETAKTGSVSGLDGLFRRLSVLHRRYAEIVKKN